MKNAMTESEQQLLRHLRFRSDILELVLDETMELPVMVEKLANRLLDISGADRVIYRGTGDRKIEACSPYMKKLGPVPEEYCAQCPYSDIENDVYSHGGAVMDDSVKGFEGVPVFGGCPVKSSIMRLVYHDGRPYGYIALQYVKEAHEFTEFERETFDQLAEIFQNVYSKYRYREDSLRAVAAMSAMAEDFDYIAAVSRKDSTVTRLMASDKIMAAAKGIDEKLPPNEKFDAFIREIVHPDDLGMFLDKPVYENSIAALETEPVYSFNFRTLMGGKEEYYRIKFAYMPDNHDTVILGLINISDQMRRESETEALKRRAENEQRLKEQMTRVMELSDDFQAIYDVELETGRFQLFSYDRDFAEGVLVHLENSGDFYADALRDAGNVVYPDDRDIIRKSFGDREYIRSMLETAGGYTIDYRLMSPDGPKWHRAKTVRKPGEDSHFLVGVFDINEMKTAEENQRRAERETMDLINGLASAYNTIYYIDLETGEYTARVVSSESDFIRDCYTSSPGYDALAKNFIDNYVHPDDRELLRPYEEYSGIRKKLAHKKVDTVRFRRKKGDGYIWMEQTYVKTVDADETPRYVISAFADRDVVIREEKKRLDIIMGLASAYNALYYIDLKSGEYSAQLISEDAGFMNDYYAKTPYFETMIGDFIDTLVYPDDREMMRTYNRLENIEKILAHKKTDTLRFRRKKGDGYIWMEQVCIKTWADGGEAQYAVVAVADRDSAVRAEMEQQETLKQALSMAESANRAKTTFLNNMSHDIRTPMNAIIGYTGLAASHIESREQVQDYLKKIGESSNHLLSLINDVLDMSRIESGKMNIEEKPESLPDIMHTLRDIVQHDMHAKQHDFFIDTVNVTDETIVCDKLRLNQVLLNILSNSIKYTAPGGTISMRITEKTVKSSGYATYEFCIKDNGMGMSGEYLKTIFDPFTRVRSSTVSGIQGTGLGMAITKNIVDMMGGRIEIESELGKGTTTTVTFDFRLNDAHREVTVIPELRGFRALVADDDTNTCESIYTMLKEVGMRSEWCTTGKEAVIRAGMAFREGDLFKVYILDWLMPDMNGIETARRIRKVIGDDAPIIILTAYDWSDIEQEAREAGVTAFVSKPMFPSDLHSVLEKCIGKQAEPAADEPGYDFSGRRILLVEDNEMNREIATDILAEAGFEVDTASDGDIAVEKMAKAEAGDYDLVLMDIQMPRLNGYDATKQIRALGTPASKIPILAMTANAFEEDRQQAMAAGMNEHIAKPIDIGRLRQLLAKYIFSGEDTDK